MAVGRCECVWGAFVAPFVIFTTEISITGKYDGGIYNNATIEKQSELQLGDS